MAMFASRPKKGKKSFGQVWKAVPWVLVFLFFAYHQTVKAADRRATARRQETAFGDVVECRPGGKSGQYCHYIFHTVDEQSYVAWSRASSDVVMGQTEDVYYDPQNPTISALKSFVVSSRDDQTWGYISLLIAAALIGVSLYTKASLHSDRQSP